MSEERLWKDINRLKRLTNGVIPEFHQDIEDVLNKLDLYKEVIEEVREYINSYDVFKEFSFPLMKREEENQTKSSIKYEFDMSIKKGLLQILDKVKEK